MTYALLAVGFVVLLVSGWNAWDEQGRLRLSMLLASAGGWAFIFAAALRELHGA